MGVRSDVGLAIKRDCWASLSVEDRASIQEVVDWKDTKTYENHEGFLFTWTDVKWYRKNYEDLLRLYKVLDKLDGHDYLLICATPEYPEDCGDDLGGWLDNPWNLHKYVSCTIEFDSNP